MGLKRSMYMAVVLMSVLLGTTPANASQCEDCMVSLPFRAMPGCQNFDYQKEAGATPSNLFMTCMCELVEKPSAFDLCSNVCPQAELDSQKASLGAVKDRFPCGSILNAPSASATSSNPGATSPSATQGTGKGSPTPTSAAFPKVSIPTLLYLVSIITLFTLTLAV
ncbi:hypothetical protein K493DRAFT_314886 [Basidiobolus meristosporus CBS 931.73]|uniref:Uncharacterized protein n=1 Tax=Basidiobolus meristosporus CBS 931.73 TaxID=1314790 RepID=A0A1Y1YC50_9FUNG|nr:hypothetical protein K493DRAFT_314886 [Basidiobolus meristosporus CBS 931.73]|eukprot:ORX95610.1 hypothetical protein K493DRAFT_314886 [Basidiobolus meristosporus CBS 931.73]